MTVILPDPPASRAGSLPLVGGNLALDFANTESGRGYQSHQNHLREATNVVDWLNHANALPAGATEWLLAEVSTRPAVAEELVQRSLALRAAIHNVSAAIARGGAPPHASLARLSGLHAEFDRARRARIRGRWMPMALEPARSAGRCGAGADCAGGGQAVYRRRFRPHQGMRRPCLRLALLRHEQEQSPPVV